MMIFLGPENTKFCWSACSCAGARTGEFSIRSSPGSIAGSRTVQSIDSI